MDNICRLCTSNTQFDKLTIPLFQENSPEFVNNLVAFLGFPINVDDGLPSQICIACSEAAIKAHKFKTKCVESNDLLWQRLRRENESPLLSDEQKRNSSHEGDPEDEFEVREAEIIEIVIKNECEPCGLFFGCEADYIEHITKHGFEKREIVNTLFSCDICDYKTNSKHDFDTHKEVNHSNTWKCSKCDYKTSFKFELQNHQKTHLPKNPFQIKARHVKINPSDIPTTFLRKQCTQMQSEERQFKCEVCSKIFKRLGNLKVHMVIHSQERRFQCEKCHRKFKMLGTLKQHMLTHLEERLFPCTKCYRKFKKSRCLNRHMLTHSQERQFKCKMCIKTFKTPRDLTRHMVTHSEERPFQCNVCPRKFKLLSVLSRHLLTHSEKKPFQCILCHRKIIHAEHFKVHMLKHLEEQTFTCDICMYTTKYKITLINHINAHAKESSL